jgi:cysteinyl-tRNA synthetase
MSIRLHNTLTREKKPKALEEYPGFDPKNVRMYVCGPTVYDYAHIGNARPAIVFDVLYRLLRHTYGADHVTYVRNITDIDDKINARAAEIAAAKGISVEEARVEVTNRTAQQYLDDVAALGCLLPNHTPRATEYVDGMIKMCEALIEAGHAYAAEGHVLYDVSSKPDYGKLSRRSLDEMMAGARVEVAPYKKNPMDFVLWKPSDDATPGWESPWGRGRPGWHIECSVMGGALLGNTFDIHGGGVDLMFPHHENEIAQSEGCHLGAPLANIWMHNGFLQVEGEKMSKSLGNFITINELLQTEKFGGRKWPGSVLRVAMLMTQYRQPIDWTVERLNEAYSKVVSWYVATSGLAPEHDVPDEVVSALGNDLNTHQAITCLDALHKNAHKEHANRQSLLNAMSFLGILPEEDVFKKFDVLKRPFGSGDAWIKEQIEARMAARKAKNFAESDRIRDELLAQGIVLKDGPNGTTWEVKR